MIQFNPYSIQLWIIPFPHSLIPGIPPCFPSHAQALSQRKLERLPSASTEPCQVPVRRSWKWPPNPGPYSNHGDFNTKAHELGYGAAITGSWWYPCTSQPRPFMTFPHGQWTPCDCFLCLVNAWKTWISSYHLSAFIKQKVIVQVVSKGFVDKRTANQIRNAASATSTQKSHKARAISCLNLYNAQRA